jgi:hypothetical protein
MAPALLLLGEPVTTYLASFQGVAHESASTLMITDDRLEGLLDDVLSELLALRAGDATVGGALARGEWEVEFLVEAADVPEAFSNATSILRSAFHAAGASTPNWELSQATVRRAAPVRT